jgi:hypothetical protein
MLGCSSCLHTNASRIKTWFNDQLQFHDVQLVRDINLVHFVIFYFVCSNNFDSDLPSAELATVNVRVLTGVRR